MTQRNIHGGHEFHFEGNLLVARSWGSWNLEAVRLYAGQWREALLKQDLTSWGACIDCVDWKLATPEAWDENMAFASWICDNGCCFLGITYSKEFIKLLSSKDIKQASSNSDMVFATFEKHNECYSWCQHQANALDLGTL